MTGSVLLDTHIALWLDAGDHRLRQSTRTLLDQNRRNGGKIFLSAVTAWEIALLAYGGRIELDISVEGWIARFLDRPGIEAALLDHRTAARAYRLDQLNHRDPADRLLIATAIELACPLVTYDKHITHFGQNYGRHCGFSVVS